ncbi:MAG: DNA alkylation response protein [Rhizobiales bacterium]|nr:DNA alkylation response protein [Hyphomicrobiales bacterium]
MASAETGLTHEVFNQSTPFENFNLFTSDTILQSVIAQEGGDPSSNRLTELGAVAGSADAAAMARQANENPPTLKPIDRYGNRQDIVEFHPAYHDLMTISMQHGLHCSSWERGGSKARADQGRNVERAAGLFMTTQMEAGHCCPITMTNASVAVLNQQGDVADNWLGKLFVHDYDHRFVPLDEKRSVTIGMGMTERQGGTDVRSNTTCAIPVEGGGPGEEYLVTGHKWFMSAPMCDAFLILAQAPGGLSCFFVPRLLPDGTPNSLRFQRLKNKLGNHSNASSEVEFHKVHAWLFGEEGRGINTIIEMVTYTRLDCAISSAGLMRQALANAIHHCNARTVFQKKLIDQPLMRQVLADMTLDQEAATALVIRLARAFDGADEDPREASIARIMSPAIKYWVCKALPGFAFEAMECLGGNGYVEDGPLARLYREAPLNAIWEGSGNVMCLDVLRAINKDPEGLQGILDGMIQCADGEARLVNAIEKLRERFANPSGLEADLRHVVERLVHTAAGCLLLKSAPDAVSEAFVSSRIKGSYRGHYGSLRGADISAILERSQPVY